MDENLLRLRRSASEGGVEARTSLLTALRRAGRPLGEAWPGRYPVRVSTTACSDQLLEALARFDPLRASHHLAAGESAALDFLVEGELRLARTGDAFELYLADGPAPSALRWQREPWRWRSDCNTVTQLAVNAEFVASVDSSGALRVANASEALNGGALWQQTLEQEVLGLGIHGDELLVVDDHLRRFALATGEERRATQLDMEQRQRVSFSEGRAVVVGGDGRVVLYDTDDRVAWDKRLGWSAERPALGPRYLALCRQDVVLYDLEQGAYVTRVERSSRVTGTWEDPESTMGMGRDVRDIVEYGPDLVRAAWLRPDRLLVANAQGALSIYSVKDAAVKRRRALGTVGRLGPESILVSELSGRQVLSAGGLGKTFWIGGDAKPKALDPRSHADGLAGVSALAVCGRVVWLGRTSGALERYELPGVSLSSPTAAE